jgi:hypothetical protein
MKVYPAMVIKTIYTFITTSTVFAKLAYLQFKDAMVNNWESQYYSLMLSLQHAANTEDSLGCMQLAELLEDRTVWYILSACNHIE